MASELDQKSLEQAFQGRADIQAAIRAAAGMRLALSSSTLQQPSCGPEPLDQVVFQEWD